MKDKDAFYHVSKQQVIMEEKEYSCFQTEMN